MTPRVVKVKTGSAAEDKYSYSRVVAVDNLVFVSNTAGRNPDTNEIPEDITEQTLQVFANLERGLSAVDCTLGDIVSIRVYVQNPQDGDAVGAVLAEKFRGIDPVCTMTCPPLGAPVYKVEIDVTAYRGVANAQVEKIVLTR